MEVIFARSSKPASLLIRLFTWSRWSHCGVIHQGDVIHATAFDGVIKQPLSEFKDRYKKHEIRIMDGRSKRSLSEVGKKYDWGGVFGHWFGLWDSSKRWFCSELVAHCSNDFISDRINRVTPEDCYMISKPTK